MGVLGTNPVGKVPTLYILTQMHISDGESLPRAGLSGPHLTSAQAGQALACLCPRPGLQRVAELSALLPLS